MAHFLFVDESGQDRRESPYEVLAGIIIQDSTLWNLVREIQEVELRIFGLRYSLDHRELKAKRLLRRKTFRQAAQLPPIAAEERKALAQACLSRGQDAGLREITALAQAKIEFVREVLSICIRHHCWALASVISRESPRPSTDEVLRKDYAYLFERFCYLLVDQFPGSMGIIVFDELEKSRSHILVGQMDRYFKHTAKGRRRSDCIIPEPFFVHSELTTGIQVADLIAYIISWGFRTPTMRLPAREELALLVDLVIKLKYDTKRFIDGIPDFVIWGFSYIEDLRGGDERNSDI